MESWLRRLVSFSRLALPTSHLRYLHSFVQSILRVHCMAISHYSTRHTNERHTQETIARKLPRNCDAHITPKPLNMAPIRLILRACTQLNPRNSTVHVGRKRIAEVAMPDSALTVAPRPTPTFLHFPKTGTSFQTSVFLLHDGRVLWNHDPLAANATDEQVGQIAALFRHPEARLLSMYWWIREKEGRCCEPRDFGWSAKEYSQVVANIVGHGKPPSSLNKFTQCQLHMVMGHRCCSRHDYGKRSMSDVLSAAKARVDRFFFVGLTEEWLLSICLFNYRMTGRRYVTLMQLKNCRPTLINTTSQSNFHSAPKDTSGLVFDDIEHALYDHVTRRFWRECESLNISAGTCPVLSNRTWGCQSQYQPKIHRDMDRALNLSRLLRFASYLQGSNPARGPHESPSPPPLSDVSSTHQPPHLPPSQSPSSASAVAPPRDAAIAPSRSWVFDTSRSGSRLALGADVGTGHWVNWGPSIKLKFG